MISFEGFLRLVVIPALFGLGTAGVGYFLLRKSQVARTVFFYWMITLPLQGGVVPGIGLASLGVEVAHETDVIVGLMLFVTGIGTALFSMWVFAHIWSQVHGSSPPGSRGLRVLARALRKLWYLVLETFSSYFRISGAQRVPMLVSSRDV